MKNTLKIAFCALLSIATAACSAQTQAATVTAPAPTPYAAVSRDMDSTTFRRTVYEVSPSGQITSRFQSYRECASGLNFKNSTTGQYMASKEDVEILADGSGASATNGAHQTYFPNDIGNGVITSIGPDGTTLRSVPIGLFFDTGTNLVPVAMLTNSIGELFGSNVVVFPNAFGPIADLRYTYRKNGLSQEVILRQRVPAPESFGADFNSANTRLELVTEFFNAPTPAQSAPISGPLGLSDRILSVGAIKFVRGKVFSIGNASPTNSPAGGADDFKSWEPMGNGTACLVEALPYRQIASDLNALPGAPGRTSKRASPVKRALLAKLLRPEPPRQAERHRMRVAAGPLRYKGGLDWDYEEVLGSETNFVFTGDSTFLISGELDLFGTTTIDPGVCVKYPANSDSPIVFYGPVNCQTTSWLPATFTASDDNTIGQEIAGSSGNPVGTYADYAIFYCNSPDSVTLHDLKINYAYDGLSMEAGSSNVIRDVQFVNDAVPLFCYQVTNYLENALIWNATNVCIWEDYSATIAENVTADGGSGLWNAWAQPSSLAATNCLFTGLATLDGGFAGGNNVTNPSSAGVYETVGGGSHYLPPDSPYRQIGTTNIDPGLLADLATRTTWPPIVYVGTNISSLGTLGPIVPRDISDAPDLGYHYDCLDWVFGACDLYGSLSFAPGTDVGWFETNGSVGPGQPYAISLNGGASLLFNGTATQPCIFARYPMVQEAENGNWNGVGFIGAIMFNGGSPVPQLSANFTKFTSDDWNGNIFRDSGSSGAGIGIFRNSEFYDSEISSYDLTALTFTNCLFFRLNQSFWDLSHVLSITNENCTYYDGQLALNRQSGENGYSQSFWSIENTIFDGTLIVYIDGHSGAAGNTLFEYNAYNTNNVSWQTYGFPYSDWTQTNILEKPDPGDVLVTNFNWQSSWFGNFYLPTNSLLFEKGSTNANLLGLYHFTIWTNQMVEGTNIVTIGYHYVATDTNGVPLDSNSDEIPDYLEDTNGNGVVDSGEIGWNLTNDIGLSVTITQPANGSTLP